MAGKTIGDLDPATDGEGTIKIEIEQDGSSKRITPHDIVHSYFILYATDNGHKMKVTIDSNGTFSYQDLDA